MRSWYFVILLLFIPVLPLFAYLDPGTGSMIVSAIIGALATVAFVLKGWFYKIFRRKKKAAEDSSEEMTDKKPE